jgi:hypothetical protein
LTSVETSQLVVGTTSIRRVKPGGALAKSGVTSRYVPAAPWNLER